MTNLRCKTNLDLLHAELWPTTLPELPRVGDLIQSGHKWQWREGHYTFQLELEVVRITWESRGGVWFPVVELHLPRGRFETITTFYEWYGKITGKGKDFFI